MSGDDQFTQVSARLIEVADAICAALERADGQARFVEDRWTRAEGGGGRTRVLSDGAVFEQAGVGYSAITGAALPGSASASRPELRGVGYRAQGVSLVLHPRNPYVPTTHCNLRYFEAQSEPLTWWFGGGFDLTPYYGFDEDARWWARTAKAVCDHHTPGEYDHFRRWCDEYFYLKHRKEPRGVGGLFFDDFQGQGFDSTLAFVGAVGEAFLEGYLPIVDRRRDTPFGERERAFQLYRRGRYVEFNLVYDRGTLFGLQSGGRTESILMSLPPLVAWRYGWQPDPGSPEALLYERFLVPRDWAREADDPPTLS